MDHQRSYGQRQFRRRRLLPIPTRKMRGMPPKDRSMAKPMGFRQRGDFVDACGRGQPTAFLK